MPVPNDLTPEEEAEFGQHGISPAGPGKEPIIENDDDIQDQGQQQTDDQQGQQQTDDQQPKKAERPRRADGTYKSQDEIEADKIRAAQGQGQQGQGEGQQGEGQQDNRTVPLAALHSERQRAATLAQRAARAEARMNAMLAAQQGQNQQQGAEKLPDLNEDPVGYIVGLERRLAAFEQARETETQTRQIDNALEADEELFKAQVPDYEDASNHYVSSRAQELLQFYPPDEAQRIMMEEARQIAQNAWQRGQSAGEVIYRLALARGYQPGQQQQDQGQQSQGQQSQGQRQQQGQRRQNATDVVRNIRENQQNNRSLSGAGGGAGKGPVNAAALLEMDDDEFEEYLALGKKGANARFAAIG